MDGKIVPVDTDKLEETPGYDNLDDILGGVSDFGDASVLYRGKSNDCIRYSIAFDATGSMQSLWRVAIKAVESAIDRLHTYKVSKPVEIQVIAYRDVADGPKMLMEKSGFSSDKDFLKAFIKRIVCDGGGDYPENVEVGLRQVLETESNMVILIGDAPPHDFPEGDWESANSNWDGKAEAIQLGNEKCPIYAMYMYDYDTGLVRSFKALAKLSGGKAYFMDGVDSFEDVLLTLLSKDKDLIKHSMAYLPYFPKTEVGKSIDKDLR